MIALLLGAALICPATCGPKWSGPHDNPSGDFSWQICVSANGGDPQTCVPNTDLPIPTQTPGDVNPVLTEAVICASGFTTRPYRNVPRELKKDVFESYGIANCPPCGKDYEVDHLIPLEVGGSNDITNLWPQAYATQPWNARVKDCLEDRLHELVCAGKVPLQEAQQAISSNWIDAYHKYMTMPVASTPSRLFKNNCENVK